MKSPCSLDENFIYGNVVAVFTKGNPLVNQFNRLIRRCVEGGLADRYWAQLKNEALLRSRTKSDEDGSSMYFVFKLSHMGPAFSVLGFGYVCSTIVCIGECLHKRFSNWWQAECRTHLPWRTRWIWTVLTAKTCPLFYGSCYKAILLLTTILRVLQQLAL